MCLLLNIVQSLKDMLLFIAFINFHSIENAIVMLKYWFGIYPFILYSYREFLTQSWMKQDKAMRAPNILAVTRRFNEVWSSFDICKQILLMLIFGYTKQTDNEDID